MKVMLKRVVALLAVIFLVAGCGSAGSNSVDNGDEVTDEQPSLNGQWLTPDCVAAPQADGSTSYLMLDFEFTETQWSLDYVVHGNEDCTFPFLTVHINGLYEITGSSSVGDDIWEGRFGFAEKSLTAHADPAAEMLNSMECGPGSWEVDTPQGILAEGCLGLGQYPESVCDADYDILRVQDDILTFGDRPADNNMCESANRPTELGGLGFAKQ